MKPQAVHNTNPNSKLYFGDWFNSFIPFFLFCENSYRFGHQERRGGYPLDRQDQIRCCSLKGFCRPYEFLGGGRIGVHNVYRIQMHTAAMLSPRQKTQLLLLDISHLCCPSKGYCTDSIKVLIIFSKIFVVLTLDMNNHNQQQALFVRS